MFNFSRVRWLRVIIAAVAIPIVVFLSGILVVTAYSFQLAFSVRGAPDQNAIAQFAQATIPMLSPWLSALSAFVITWFATRKLGASAMTNAIAIGGLTGIFLLGMELAGGITLTALFNFLAPIAGSLIAGWLNQRQPRTQSAI